MNISAGSEDIAIARVGVKLHKTIEVRVSPGQTF
jgi:hypothetical protein